MGESEKKRREQGDIEPDSKQEISQGRNGETDSERDSERDAEKWHQAS